MEHVSNDHEDRPNQHENSHKLCDETGHPVLSLTDMKTETMNTETTASSEFLNGGGEPL